MARLGCGLTIHEDNSDSSQRSKWDCWDMHCFSIWKAQRLLVYPFLFDPTTQAVWNHQPMLGDGSISFPSTVHCLVVYLSLRKIWKSVGIMKFPIYGTIKHVPNHHQQFNMANLDLSYISWHRWQSMTNPLGGSPHLATSFWKKSGEFESPKQVFPVFPYFPMDNWASSPG